MEFGELSFKVLLPTPELVDLLVELGAVAGRCVGEVVLFTFEVGAFITEGSEALLVSIDLVFLPVGSPDLNPIEPIWKSLKWEASPMIVESAEEFRALVTDLFDRLTNRLSFATSWIDEFLDSRLQKLS